MNGLGRGREWGGAQAPEGFRWAGGGGRAKHLEGRKGLSWKEVTINNTEICCLYLGHHSRDHYPPPGLGSPTSDAQCRAFP